MDDFESTIGSEDISILLLMFLPEKVELVKLCLCPTSSPLSLLRLKEVAYLWQICKVNQDEVPSMFSQLNLSMFFL